MKESWLLFSSLFILSVLAPFRLFLTNDDSKNLPPSPFALPILGHLHLVKPPLHRTLESLSQKYGQIFSLKLGSQLFVIVSSPSAVEECFSKYDLVLANRPYFTFNKFVGYNFTTLLSTSYGDNWLKVRKIVTHEVVSPERIDKFKDEQRDELKILLNKLQSLSADKFTKVELKPLILGLSTNTVTRLIAGKRYYGDDVGGTEEAKHVQELVQQVFIMGGESYLGDFLPILKYFDIQGFEKRAKKLATDFDVFFQGLIDERRRNNRGLENGNTMIDHLLSLQDSQPEMYTDQLIKGIGVNMIGGGTQTMAAMIEWAMANLLNNPVMLKKARAEIDALLGSKQMLDETDLPKLPYLQSVLHETFRLHPIVPLLAPHRSSDNFTVGGYNIPPNTILLVNAWAVHRNHKVWDDSTSFNPERFDTGEVDPYKIFPFGVGMRQCPGMSLARRVIGLTVGTLIQNFEWEKIDGKLIDLVEETTGILKPKKLDVLCKSRSFTNSGPVHGVL